VPGYEASAFYGLGVPRNMPAVIIEKLNNALNAGLGAPTMRAKFNELGAMVLPGSAADFGKLIVEETAKWAKVIQAAGIKAE
jgi:tripartite-type tricarboxylate transporter receptor subunit TctC